jgi:hypothetical protein
MKVEIHLFLGGGSLWASRRRKSHGGVHTVRSFLELGFVFKYRTNYVCLWLVCLDEMDDRAKSDDAALSPVNEPPQPMLSPALESPGVTRSRTMPSSKGSKDVSGDEKQQQQQRTRVLRKQKRTSIQLPKKSEPIASP